MEEQTFFIEGPLPGLNEIIALAKRRGKPTRSGRAWSGYAETKKMWGEIIALTALSQGMEPVTKRAWILFTWIERDLKRDPDNVSGGGRKLVLDGLVKAGILRKDGQKDIAGFTETFTCVSESHKRPGVIIQIL